MEDICNGRQSIDILEDVFEAFIGAMYLDFENHEICKDFIINLIEEKVDFAELIMNDTNFKGKLTKYYMKMYQMKLSFKQIEKTGTLIKIGIYDNEGKLLEEGIGSNKKDAEQNASKELLIKMDIL